MPVLPDFDAIRYTFGDTTVMFRAKDGDPNRLSVELTPTPKGPGLPPN
jgi:hypothetical protein